MIDIGDEMARKLGLERGSQEALQPGEAFLLVNDHDPKPLYYQFKFEHERQFSWDYVEQGPDVWQVHVGKTA